MQLNSFLSRDCQRCWVLHHANLVHSRLCVYLHNTGAEIFLNIFNWIYVNCLVTSWASHKIRLIFWNCDSINWTFVLVKCGYQCSMWSKIRDPCALDILCLFSMLIKYFKSNCLFCCETVELINYTCLRTSSSQLYFWVDSHQTTYFPSLSCLQIFKVVCFGNLRYYFKGFEYLSHLKWYRG